MCPRGRWFRKVGCVRPWHVVPTCSCTWHLVALGRPLCPRPAHLPLFFSLELAVLCAWTAFRTLPSVNALAGLWGGGGGELRALGVTGLCLRWEAGGLRASKSSGESGPLPCATRTSEGWARTTAASPGRGLRGSSQAGLGEAGSERPSDVCLRCSRLRDVTPGGPGEVPGVC